MPEKMLVTYGPRKILEIPGNSVGIIMKKKSFGKLMAELSRIQDELEKGKATVVRKVLRGAKVIYVEGDYVEGSVRHRERDQKRGKKK